MLRRQSSDRTPLSFLAGSGEMARRLRAFDWAGHALGQPDSWPQSLRSALGICLNSAFPTAIYWGPELRLLYNDAWSGIPGPRHPACLGEPAAEVWSDIWHVIKPQFTRVIETGEGLFVDDQLLPMRRFGYEEETYWSYSFTPIRGEDGAIEGIFNSGQETTARVLKQRQTAFLLGLVDRLRARDDARGVMDEGCRMLGEHLGAIRCGVREVDEDGDLSVTVEWTADGIMEAGPGLPWDRLGAVARRLEDGLIVRIDRTNGLSEPEARAFGDIGAASVLAVPWHRFGDLGAVLFVHRAQVQPWTDEEVATAEQVFSRLMQAMELERGRAREATMMQEIEHRARNMLGVSQALIRMTQAGDVETFRRSLLDRTRALGSTLQVLSESNWLGADLEELLKRELAPFASDDGARISIRGRRFMVPRLMAQPISMAFHELVTNAVKYGALSRPDGYLDVSWSVRPDGVLDVEWLERNVQPGKGDDARRSGFGTSLLTMTIESQMGGKFSRRFDGSDFRCRMEVPVPRDE